MVNPRFALAFALLAVSALVFVPAPASAADPDIGCGGDVIEICIPVCVTDPCPAYVCVHTRPTSVCQVLWT